LCLEICLSKHKMTFFSNIFLGYMTPLSSPGYAYVYVCGLHTSLICWGDKRNKKKKQKSWCATKHTEVFVCYARELLQKNKHRKNVPTTFCGASLTCELWRAITHVICQRASDNFLLHLHLTKFRVSTKLQTCILCSTLRTEWKMSAHIFVVPIRAWKRASVPGKQGDLMKRYSQIWLTTCVSAHRYTRTKLTKNRFHTFPFSTLIFV